MFPKNQSVETICKWWKHSLQKLAFGWRSAFSSAIRGPRLAPALAVERVNSSALSQTLVQMHKISSKHRTTAIPPRIGKRFSRVRGSEAAALIEFAVALPLLVVLVVGIFDFGGAFNLKQELSNAAREGARFGASQPTNDFSAGNPPSVDAVRYVVDSY